MLHEFLLVSGWLFWGILAILFLIELAAANAFEENGVGVFIAVVAILAAALFTDAFKSAQILWLAVFAVAYFALGVVWAFKKWYDLIVKERESLKLQYAEKVERKLPGLVTWGAYRLDKQPKAKDNKQQLTNWMALWPFSFSWWVLTWPRHAFVWAYNRLVTVFDRISERIFQG